MVFSQGYDGDDHASDSTLTGSTVSFDLLHNRILPGKTKRFQDYDLGKENDLPQLKKYSKSPSKTKPKWTVNRKQSLVQWLERESPFNKKKTSSNHSLHSPKKSNRKRLTQLNNDSRSSDDSCSKRKHVGQILNVYPAVVQRPPKTKLQTPNKVKFPFKTTPSGNFKLEPSQVVYESKNLSIIAADPGNITLNVTESSKTVETAAETKLKDDNWTTTCLYSAVREGMIPFGSEFSDTGESDQGLFTKGKSASKASEVNLAKMGYVPDNCIDWNKCSNLPIKSDLHNLIMHHIINVINPDIQIKIGETTYNCHRIVLQCYCTYFTNKTGLQIELPKSSMKKEAFQSIYQWMLYQGADSFRLLRKDTILDIFKGAQFLGIKELENQCWAFIDNLDLFSEDKAFLLYLEARKLGNKDIMEMMVPRVQRFFLTLVSSKEFVEFSFEEVCTFLRSNYICIHCEMEVFLSAIRWLSYDWPQRQKHVVAVMSCIRFGLMDAIALISLKRNPQSPEYQHIATVPEVAQMIEDGMAFTLLKSNESKQPGTFESFKVPKPAPRNWAGTDKKYSTYQEFLQDLSFYRSKHRLEIKQSKMQMDLEKVEDNDFMSTAVLLPTTEQKIKKIHSGQSNLHKFVKLEPRELNLLKKLFCQEEKKPKDRSKELKLKLYSMTEEGYNSKPCPPCSPKPQFTLENGKIDSHHEQELAACKIQNAYRGYSSRKIRAGADKGHSSGLLTRSRSDPSLPLRITASTPQPHQRPFKADEVVIKTGKETVFIFGGSDPFDPDSDISIGQMVHQYERGRNQWRKCAEMPEPSHFHSVVYFHGKVYVAGGKNTMRHPKEAGAISRKVWRYDPKYQGWSRLKDMPHARRSFSLVAMNNQLYAIGGRDEKERVMAHVEMYNLETERWYAVKSMTTPRAGSAACEHQGLIWVAGGVVDEMNTPTNTVEQYNPKNDEWAIFSYLRYTLAYGVMVDVEGRIYIVGGAVGLPQSNSSGSGRQIDVWNMKKRDWCLGAMMSKPRHAHAAVYLKPERDANPGLVFILGGMMSKHDAVTADVECWQEEDNSWHVGVVRLPHAVSGLAAVVMPSGTMG